MQPDATRCNRRRPVAHIHAHCSYTSNVSWKRPQVVTAVATDTNLFEELTNKWTFIPGPSQNGRPTTYVDIYVGLGADAPLRPGAAACSDWTGPACGQLPCALLKGPGHRHLLPCRSPHLDLSAHPESVALLRGLACPALSALSPTGRVRVQKPGVRAAGTCRVRQGDPGDDQGLRGTRRLNIRLAPELTPTRRRATPGPKRYLE